MGRSGSKQPTGTEGGRPVDGFAAVSAEMRGPVRQPRMLDHGDLRYVLLHLIAGKPSHGYELMKAVEEQFCGMYTPSPGVIYPTLTLLEELGHLRSEPSAGTKRLFSVTPQGAEFIEAHQPLLDCIQARVKALKAICGTPPAPEIEHAIRGATAALSARLSRPLAADSVATICTLLDRFAADIDRA